MEKKIPGSILGGYLQGFFFVFFTLIKKKMVESENNFKCSENGIDRLRNGQLRRRPTEIFSLCGIDEACCYSSVEGKFGTLWLLRKIVA